MTNARTTGIGLLAFFMFLLLGMPKLNIRLGPVPLYMIDVVAALMLYQTARIGRGVTLPFRGLVLAIGFLVVLSELSVIVYGGSILDAVYLSIRYCLAFGIMFTIPKVLRSAADVEIVLKGMVLGLLLTSVIMLFSSLPQTRGIAVLVLSIPFLEPSDAADRVRSLSAEAGGRGRSLVGVSILSAAFISIGWPFAAYLRTARFRLSAFWSLTAGTAVLLAPMAIVVGYSRQGLVGGMLIVLTALILPFGALRRSLLRPVLVSMLVVATVGAGSSLFFFDRYVNRFSATLDAPLENRNESARFLSYVVPFEHVVDNPQFMFVGAGATAERFPGLAISSFEENHSLLGAGYFAHGMLSTLLLLFLVIAGLRYANWHRAESRYLAKTAMGWPRALFLAYLPVLPMAAFAPALGTNIRAMYIFMMLMGLLASLRNDSLIASLESESEPDPAPAVDRSQEPSASARPAVVARGVT